MIYLVNQMFISILTFYIFVRKKKRTHNDYDYYFYLVVFFSKRNKDKFENVQHARYLNIFIRNFKC